MAAAGTRKNAGLRRRSSAAAGSARLGLARAIRAVASVAALILVIGIALVLLKANQSNALVGAVHDAASWLAGPFEGMFKLDRHRIETAVNWGIAAVVWLVVGRLIARVVAP